MKNIFLIKVKQEYALPLTMFKDLPTVHSGEMSEGCVTKK